jgi:hypothetical protein
MSRLWNNKLEGTLKQKVFLMKAGLAGVKALDIQNSDHLK